MKFTKILMAALCCLVCAAAFADNVTFSYQGQVKVNGSPYTGTGLFKFAIMNTSATATLWSNDGTLGSEPAASVSLSVDNGVFSVVVGDTTIPGMQTINSSVFAAHTPLKLRVWFNGNSLGFQQLNPDQKLVDLALNTVSTGNQDYTIYVNGTTGNDANNGLTVATAKKTIQAAVDIVPAQLRCNVTIKVAAGVYKETVSVFGITASGSAYDQGIDGNFLRILGDETWTTTSLGIPNVRILGSDIDTTVAPRLRKFCVAAHNCSAVQFEGMSFENAGGSGIKVETGSYVIKNCRASNNYFAGFAVLQGAFGNTHSCEAVGNTNGIYMFNGIIYVGGCNSHHNSVNGVAIQGPGYAQIFTGCKSNDNVAGTGYAVRDNGSIGIAAGAQAHSNGRYGLELVTGSTSVGASGGDFTPNTLGAIGTNPGGASY